MSCAAFAGFPARRQALANTCTSWRAGVMMRQGVRRAAFARAATRALACARQGWLLGPRRAHRVVLELVRLRPRCARPPAAALPRRQASRCIVLGGRLDAQRLADPWHARRARGMDARARETAARCRLLGLRPRRGDLAKLRGLRGMQRAAGWPRRARREGRAEVGPELGEDLVAVGEEHRCGRGRGRGGRRRGGGKKRKRLSD